MTTENQTTENQQTSKEPAASPQQAAEHIAALFNVEKMVAEAKAAIDAHVSSNAKAALDTLVNSAHAEFKSRLESLVAEATDEFIRVASKKFSEMIEKLPDSNLQQAPSVPEESTEVKIAGKPAGVNHGLAER